MDEHRMRKPKEQDQQHEAPPEETDSTTKSQTSMTSQLIPTNERKKSVKIKRRKRHSPKPTDESCLGGQCGRTELQSTSYGSRDTGASNSPERNVLDPSVSPNETFGTGDTTDKFHKPNPLEAPEVSLQEPGPLAEHEEHEEREDPRRVPASDKWARFWVNTFIGARASR